MVLLRSVSTSSQIITLRHILCCTQSNEIDQLLDIGHASKPGNRQILLTILQNVRFLARQGLPLRGDGTEDNSNFMQVLQLRAVDNTLNHEWLKRKNETYTTKDIQFSS